jgi:hypothetical protein
VELHELHVGEPRAGAPGDRVAVAGGHLRVRGVAVHLAAAAGGEHGRVGGDLDGAAGHARPRAGAAAPRPLAVDHEVEHARLLEHADARARLHALDERPRHLGARLVAARVDDAARRVRGLAPELEVAAVLGAVERGPGGVELAHAVGPLLDEHLHGVGVAQRGPGGERVGAVEGGRVAGAERRGDAALRVRGGRVEERALGEEQHVGVAGGAGAAGARAELGGAPRGVEPGHAGADDENARAEAVDHAGREADRGTRTERRARGRGGPGHARRNLARDVRYIPRLSVGRPVRARRGAGAVLLFTRISFAHAALSPPPGRAVRRRRRGRGPVRRPAAAQQPAAPRPPPATSTRTSPARSASRCSPSRASSRRPTPRPSTRPCARP